MARGSKCPDTGFKRKDCFCFKCLTRHNNAIQRSGDLRRDRKGTDRKDTTPRVATTKVAAVTASSAS
jgi:hypothetical protein cdivTM_21224